MRISKFTHLLMLAIAVPALASSEHVIVTVSTTDAAPVSDNLVAESISAEVTNLSGSEIKNVTLRPDGTAQVFMTGAVLQFGALADGGTNTVRHSYQRLVEEVDDQTPITWRLDFDDSSGQHQRLFISTE